MWSCIFEIQIVDKMKQNEKYSVMYQIMLRTRFEENLGWIPDCKSISLGFVDQSSHPDANPRLDIKILGREFQMCSRMSEVQLVDRI